jgi:putative transposase
MSDLFLLSAAQMRRIEPYFPLSHGVARVDDRKVISGIIFVIRNGLRWRDAPKEYGPHKTIYNRFIRWSRLGVFNKIFAALAAKGGKSDQLMIDATHLKAHRTAASLRACSKRGCSPMYRAHQRRLEFQAACRLRRPRTTAGHAAQRRPDERLQGRGADD